MTDEDPDPAVTDRLIRYMVEAITDYAIYRLDRNGIVTSWNPGAERAKGYKKEEIIGRHFSVFFTNEDRKKGRPARALKSALLDGRFEDEGWRVRKDGSGFWASVVIDPIRDEAGECTGFAKITRDQSEKHAAFQALQESEQRFRLLVESISDYAIYTLDLRGHITSWNSGGKRTKGYTKDDVIGRSFSMFFTSEDQANGKPARILQIARDDGRFEEEAWRVRKDGTQFWANVVVEPIRNRSGELIGYAKVTRDITERHALERARTQLQYAQKMEKVGEISGGIAHDFNNLLTAVLGSLELVENLNCDTKLDRYIKIAQQAAERGSKITHQLLAFSRKQTLQPVTTDLNHLMSEYEDLLRVAVGELSTFSLDLTKQVLLVDVDQAQLMSALLNLVVNARDAMRKGGSLTIATGREAVDTVAAKHLNDLDPGSYVTVEVRDTGPGMSEETRSHAIEPFFTTKDVGQGTGLGLSQVYGLVKQSGGHMEIKSEIDRGTSVLLYFPVSMSESPELVPAPSCMVARSEGTVLVVDDDPGILDIASDSLRSLGYIVLATLDASEALEILQKPEPVDLLFTDIIMPKGVNGVELARRATLLRPDIRVLLASGYPREALQESQGLSENMAFIAKPYTLSKLNEKLGLLKLTKSFMTFERAESIAELAMRDPYAALAELRRRATDHDVDLDLKAAAQLLLRMFDNAGVTKAARDREPFAF